MSRVDILQITNINRVDCAPLSATCDLARVKLHRALQCVTAVPIGKHHVGLIGSHYEFGADFVQIHVVINTKTGDMQPLEVLGGFPALNHTQVTIALTSTKCSHAFDERCLIQFVSFTVSVVLTEYISIVISDIWGDGKDQSVNLLSSSSDDKHTVRVRQLAQLDDGNTVLAQAHSQHWQAGVGLSGGIAALLFSSSPHDMSNGNMFMLHLEDGHRCAWTVPSTSGCAAPIAIGCSITRVGDNVIKHGGIVNGTTTSITYVLSLTHWRWDIVHECVTYATPSPRAYHAATVVDGGLLIFGGEGVGRGNELLHDAHMLNIVKQHDAPTATDVSIGVWSPVMLPPQSCLPSRAISVRVATSLMLIGGMRHKPSSTTPVQLSSHVYSVMLCPPEVHVETSTFARDVYSFNMHDGSDLHIQCVDVNTGALKTLTCSAAITMAACPGVCQHVIPGSPATLNCSTIVDIAVVVFLEYVTTGACDIPTRCVRDVLQLCERFGLIDTPLHSTLSSSVVMSSLTDAAVTLRDQHIAVPVKEFHRRLQDNLRSLQASLGHLPAVTLEFVDVEGTPHAIRAHRDILAARSVFFRGALCSSWSATDGVIRLSDAVGSPLSVGVVQALLDYCKQHV